MKDALPLKARVTRWDPNDRVGGAELSTGETVRFGGTACKGIDPAVGMTVYVNDLSPHSLGGRKAGVVRIDAITEPEARERETARAEAERAETLRPLREVESKLPAMPLDDDFIPSPQRIHSVLDARTVGLLRALDQHADALAKVAFEIALDEPWTFYDPSLWTFAGDGGGNVFALHYYPPAVEAASRVPIVFWDHELHAHFFQAEGLEPFLGEYLQQCAVSDPQIQKQCLELAKQLGLRLTPPAEDHLREDAHDTLDWPLPTSSELTPVPLEAIHLRERALVRQLIDASFARPPFQGVLEALSGLDALYRELGWKHHLNVLRHQRIEWFDLQTRHLTTPRS